MFTSAELIEALRRRMRRSLRPPPQPGEFPPGWREWFETMAARPGRISGAPPGDVIAVVAAREPAPPPGIVEQLGRWRAFGILWRQEWQPASSDERWTRVASMSGTLLFHLLFAVVMGWLMFTRSWFPDPAAEARQGEEHVLQVEYIGAGTPAEAAGGGAPEAPVESPVAPAPAPAAASADVVAPTTPSGSPAGEAPAESVVEATPPPLQVREVVVEVPQLREPVMAAPRELQVTVVEVPDSSFAVPPPRETRVRAPEAAAAEVAVRRREIQLAAPGAVQAPAVRTPAEVSVREASPQGVAVVERRVELADAPDIRLPPSQVAAPAITTREARVEAPAAPSREVPMPVARAVPTPATDAGTAPSASARTAEGRAQAPASAAAGGRPDAGSGTRGTDAAAGAGPRPDPAPGALPSTRAADDWGDSTRDVQGRQAGTPGASGLFDGDGRPRLADGGRVGGGLPPGTMTEDFANIDRHGTWLKRPPYDYEPTSFDRFWLPSESLLEEWVRKSVTEVRIPIPGTTKSIRCVTVMLALGGACDILDPNLQEQPARARKPPDVPFKRELQEDQESLGQPPGS